MFVHCAGRVGRRKMSDDDKSDIIGLVWAYLGALIGLFLMYWYDLRLL